LARRSGEPGARTSGPGGASPRNGLSRVATLKVRSFLAGLGFCVGLASALVVLERPARSARVAPPGLLAVDPEIPAIATSYEDAAPLPPELAADPDMVLAEEALGKGKVDEALAHFDAARGRHPRAAEPLLSMARIFLARRQVEVAVRAAGEAAAVAPGSAACQMVLGEALDAFGERDRAEQAFLAAAAIAPTDPRPIYQLGRIAEARRQVQVAIDRYRQALKIDPAFAPAAHYLASQLRSAGEYDEAVKLLLAALGREPANLSLRLNLAHTYLRKGDAQRAADEFQKAIARAGDIAEAHYFLGRALESLKKDGEAEAALRKALALDPHLTMAWYALAQLHEHGGKRDEAARELKEFEKARALQDRIKGLRDQVAKHPGDLPGLVDLGQALLERDQPREAMDSLRKALDLDPANATARGLFSRAEEESRKRPARPPAMTR
jgi:tetratricopeptide (TPR) repeat protein